MATNSVIDLGLGSAPSFLFKFPEVSANFQLHATQFVRTSNRECTEWVKLFGVKNAVGVGNSPKAKDVFVPVAI